MRTKSTRDVNTALVKREHELPAHGQVCTTVRPSMSGEPYDTRCPIPGSTSHLPNKGELPPREVAVGDKRKRVLPGKEENHEQPHGHEEPQGTN